MAQNLTPAQNLSQASNSTSMQLQWLDENGNNDSLRVIAIDNIPNHGDAISGYFQCKLRVFAPRYYSNSYLLDRAATLIWYGLTAEQALPGLITNAQFSGRKTPSDHHAFAYEIIFSSPLASMQANRAVRIFVEKTPDAIIKTILKDNGWPDSQVKFQLSQSYTARPLTIQYQQSDLGFIQYLAAQYGFIYNISRSDEMPTISFYDDSAVIAAPAPQTLFYQPYTGQAHADATVTMLTSHTQLLPQSIQLTDYNEATPLALSFTQNNATTLSGAGTQVIPNLELYDSNNGAWFTKVRQEACDSARIEWHAVSNSPSLVPGQCINLVLTDGTQMPLRIIEIAHQAEQRTLDKTTNKKLNVQYSNRLRLIPATQSYRATPIPQKPFPYLSVVRIESLGSTYAYLNEQGYYKIRFSYDNSAAKPGTASNFVALVQTHGGPQYGMHHPYLPDTLAVVGYINDDMNRPIILGALAEEDKPNPGTSLNTSQHNLATHEGHSLVLEDNTAAPFITLSTPQSYNQLCLSANSNSPQLQLDCEQGPTQLQAGQAATVNTQLQQGEEATSNYNATVQNQQKLATQKQDINQQAATDVQINSNQSIQQQTAAQGMIWQNPQDMLTQVQQDLSLNLQNNLSFNATQTKQTWAGSTGMTLQGQSQANFNINQNQGLVLLDSQGNLNSNSPQLTLNTQNTSIYSDIAVNPTSSSNNGSQSTGTMGQIGNLIANIALNLALDVVAVAGDEVGVGEAVQVVATEKIVADVAEIEARKAVASNFYREAGFSNDDINKYLPGINFNNPVEIVKLPVGTKLQQYQISGRPQGNYYSELGEIADSLGINPQAYSEIEQQVIDKLPKIYITQNEILALRSTTAEIVDDWSVPWEPYSAPGGGIQYFVPEQEQLLSLINQ